MRYCTLLLLAAAQPAWADAGLASGSAPAIPWVRLVLSFAICVGVAVGAVWAIRRFQGRSPGRPLAALLSGAQGVRPGIRMIETRRISVHADLCLVEHDGERLLLAATAHGVDVLRRNPIPAEQTEGPAA